MPTLKQLIRQVYFPPRRHAGWSLEIIAKGAEIRYFSYGRYALLTALSIIGVKKGDSVLVPAFICRDLLAAINCHGALPLFYPVGAGLGLDEPPENLPHAKAILAVNYFGFPQELTPFGKYCQRTGAVLIEDNAHGLFSRDEAGVVLGTRGAIGIFSLRKTVPLPNGAALLLNASGKSWLAPPQIPPSNRTPSRTFKVKRLLRCMAPFIGIGILRQLTGLGRRLRKLQSGYEIAPSPPDAERKLPESPAPCRELLEALAGVDVDQEISRRRELYLELEKIIRAAGGEPVFDILPQYTSPYVFPFRAKGAQLTAVRQHLEAFGLECHPWPDLPDAVAPEAPEHCRTVWMVGFLW